MNLKDFDYFMSSFLNNDIDEFRYLINQGMNLNCLNEDGESLISRIMHYKETKKRRKFFNLLLKNNVSLKQIGIEENLLNISINRNEYYYIKKLLEYNININVSGKYKFANWDDESRSDPAPIFTSIKNFNEPVINLLLKNNVDLDIETENGDTILNYLVKRYFLYRKNKKLLPIFKKLIKHGANPDVIGKKGCRTIHILAERKNTMNFFEILYKNNCKININAKNSFGKTALMLAIENDNFEISEFLIKKGANLFITNCCGNNTLHIIADKINKTNKTKHKKLFKKISKSHPELLNVKNSNNKTPYNMLNTIIKY